jgi:tRNA threonylcarbamoyladenosine biosynthesis protein TsaB
MEASPLFLLLDTSRKSCSVALCRGAELVYKTAFAPGMKASERLHIMIAECFEASDFQLSDLSAVAVSIGPGSYTGLRIGLSAAKGFCLSLDIPLIAIPTLQQLAAVAFENHPDGTYISMIDARRDEVYAGMYDNELKETGSPIAAIVNKEWINNIKDRFSNPVFCGDGAFKVSLLGDYKTYVDEVHAAAMLPLVVQKWDAQQFESLHTCVPIYLKGPHITSPKKVLFS